MIYMRPGECIWIFAYADIVRPAHFREFRSRSAKGCCRGGGSSSGIKDFPESKEMQRDAAELKTFFSKTRVDK